MFVSYRLGRTLRIPLFILLRFSLDLLSPLASEVEEPSPLALNKLATKPVIRSMKKPPGSTVLSPCFHSLLSPDQ